MTRWCIECAQQQQHQAATKTVDGDPLCDFHAKKAGESSSETEPVTPDPAKKPRGPYRKRTEATDRVLWKARFSIQQRKDEFLFRASEEFSEALTIATDLLDSSPSCQMVGAVIVGIERVGRFWN